MVRLIGIIFLLSSLASAADLGFDETINGSIIPKENSHFYEVLPGSEIYYQIESATAEVFDSPLGKSLCEIYYDPYILSYSLGISIEKSTEITKHCTSHKSQDLRLPKTFQKKYIVALDDNAEVPVQSWTTGYNSTIIYLDKNMTYADLKNLIIHEIAIAHDAKMNMLYTTYTASFDKNYNGVIYAPENLTKEQDVLRLAFNSATYYPIAYTFATMRGFNLENIVEGRRLETVNDHDKCAEEFLKLLPLQVENQKTLRVGANTLQGMLSDVFISNTNPPANLELVVKNLLDRKLTLKLASKQTFCQYMSNPLLTNRSAWSFFANGPRPRIGGGWRTSPEDKKILKQIVIEDIKDGKLQQLERKWQQ